MTRNLSWALLLAFAIFPWAAFSREYAPIARIAYLEGHVRFQHPGEVDWTEASINLALQPGDRVYTGEDGRAEIEFDEGSVLRMAEKTDVELLSLAESSLEIRVLLGLCTLTNRSNAHFGVRTPAASFIALRDGVYRFDVTESGSSDGIVRKGQMEVSAANLQQRLDAGELIHVEPGDRAEHVVSRYEGRDQWDEWTDRRTADAVAYESRRYLPDYVYVGVSDLDRYGRWVQVDTYGYAWTPHYVDPGWSPYWDGRWCYRPLWGWTWVSYEPWGWLPYHYGRWHFTTSFGWCWLPGPSYGFHFWSPGMVRFYHGPSWVSWVPLGPGDYYNVNQFYYSPRHSQHLNKMRLAQHRNPEDLANRHVPGAFRTSQTEQFVNGSGRGIASGLSSGEAQPGRGGRMVTDRLPVAPTARSFMPVGDRGGNPGAPSGDGNRPLAGIAAGGIARRGNLGAEGSYERRGTSRGEPGTPDSLRNERQGQATVEHSSARGENAGRDAAAQGVRIWNRVDTPGQGVERREGAGAGGAVRPANPRSQGRGEPGNQRSQQVPDSPSRPSVIERSTSGSLSERRSSYQTPSESAPRYGVARSYSVPQTTPSIQRYYGGETYGSTSGGAESGSQPRYAAPQAAPSRPVQPSYPTAVPRSGIERWQDSSGNRGSGSAQPSFGGGRQPSAAPSIIHSPSGGGRSPVSGIGTGGGGRLRGVPRQEAAKASTAAGIVEDRPREHPQALSSRSL